MFDRILCKIYHKKEITVGDISLPIALIVILTYVIYECVMYAHTTAFEELMAEIKQLVILFGSMFGAAVLVGLMLHPEVVIARCPNAKDDEKK